MKLNNKGFAISTVMYMILIMAVVLITLTLTLLSSRKLILDKIKSETMDNIYNEEETPEKPIVVGKFDSVCSPAEGTMDMTAGTKYNCKVDPNKDPYTFYILTTPEEGATSVNLIMDSNITADGNAIKDASPIDTGLVAWVTKENYISVGGTEEDYHTDGNNNKGPITAMNYLQTATSAWTNLNTMTVSTFTDESGATYNMGKTYTTYARLPYYSEVMAIGCGYGASGTCPNWMVDYLSAYTSSYPNRTAVSGVQGYWTFSAYASNSNVAWFVSYFGNAYGTDVYRDGYIGVRPVITLSI